MSTATEEKTLSKESEEQLEKAATEVGHDKLSASFTNAETAAERRPAAYD